MCCIVFTWHHAGIACKELNFSQPYYLGKNWLQSSIFRVNTLNWQLNWPFISFLNSSIELIRKENSTPSPHFWLVGCFKISAKMLISITFEELSKLTMIIILFSLGYFLFRRFGTQRWKLDNFSPPLCTVSKAKKGERMSCSKEFMHKKAAQWMIDSLWTFNTPIEKGIREHYHNADTAFLFSYM